MSEECSFLWGWAERTRRVLAAAHTEAPGDSPSLETGPGPSAAPSAEDAGDADRTAAPARAAERRE